MLVKGMLCIILAFLIITAITTLSFIFVRKPAWCNEKLHAGECAMHELDDTCYCIDMIKEVQTANDSPPPGLYEQAEGQCQILEGMLAAPENQELQVLLAKRMFSMGVDNAFVGLKQIGPKWFWIKEDGAQEAVDIPWRKDFPLDPEHKYATINVETIQKEDEDEYFGYRNYNYNHYIEHDRNYRWFGFASSDNSLHGDYEKAYLICHYTTAPQIPVKTETTAEHKTTQQIPTDPCYCSSNEEIILNNLEDSATFTSPKYPSNYCSDLNCRWIVKTKDGLTINLDWLVFSIEKEMDFVYIYDGESDDSPLIDECTSSSCKDRKSSSYVLHVHFHTDHVTTDLGFKARVTAIDPDPCYCSEHSIITLANLGESYTLTSPNYPEAYCPDQTCKWTVSAPEGLGIRIMWDSYKTKPFDHVDLYNIEMGEKILLQNCTGDKCKDAVTRGEALHVHFTSDHQVGIGTKFSAVLTSVENYCTEQPDLPLGIITYSERKEDGIIPVGAAATLTCPVGSLTMKSNAMQDMITCESPNWNDTLDECIQICELNVAGVDFQMPIHLCYYDGQPFNGVAKGQVYVDSLVAVGQQITMQEYVKNSKKLMESFTCNKAGWSPHAPSCHTVGILLIGGKETQGWSQGHSLEYVTPHTNSTQILDLELSPPRHQHISVTLGNGKVMIAGGNPDFPAATFATTEIIDLTTGVITNGPSMLSERNAFAGTYFNGEVWVCGGMWLRSCEKLTKQMKWQKVQDMNEMRTNAAMIGVEGSGVYVMGGNDFDWWGNEFTSKSVEKYSIQDQNWYYVADMRAKRQEFAIAQHNGLIYACGGGNAGSYSTVDGQETCERYHPDDDQWQDIASMIHEHRHFSLMPIGGILCAVDQYQKQTEIYDPKADAWHKGIDLLALRRELGSAVIVPFYDDG